MTSTMGAIVIVVEWLTVHIHFMQVVSRFSFEPGSISQWNMMKKRSRVRLQHSSLCKRGMLDSVVDSML